MCETANPNIPVGAMGPIKFPSDGNPGSGDVIVPNRKRKKRVYKQKPSHTVIPFEEFVSKRKQDSDSQD